MLTKYALVAIVVLCCTVLGFALIYFADFGRRFSSNVRR
jgi:hypothetical protein